MAGRILVAYATRKGSTAGIAQAVGKELQSAGYSVDVTEMKTVTNVSGYNAVVIGAPLYMGSIVKDAGTFVGRYRDQLVKIPVAAFAVGVAPVSKDTQKIEDSIKALHASLAPLLPMASTVFAGKLDPANLSFVQRMMTGFVKAPVGDFRDWSAISAWAKGLPEKLKV
ncbi:MAG: flavodoxin domain-containing protein [Methanoregula sp.]|nr:MAG: flavodoxin domain-containing protein [Methanoregula sp.]